MAKIAKSALKAEGSLSLREWMKISGGGSYFYFRLLFPSNVCMHVFFNTYIYGYVGR